MLVMLFAIKTVNTLTQKLEIKPSKKLVKSSLHDSSSHHKKSI